MYVDSDTPSSGAGGWAVDPSQVQAFAAAVADVQQQLDRIKREVDDLSTPDYAPLLGTSPVGNELAEKFADRMGSERGLRGQLAVALTNVQEFVSSAQLTAATYLQTEADNTSKLTYH